MDYSSAIQSARDAAADSNWQATEEASKRALEYDSNSEEAWRLQIKALGKQRKIGDAIEAAKRLLAIKPQDLTTIKQIATFYVVSGNFPMAVSWFDEALKQDPDDALLWNNKGICLSSLGTFTEASESFKRALKINPGAAAFHLNYGKCLQQQQDLAGAAQEYRQVMELDPTLLEAPRALREIAAKLGDNYEQLRCLNAIASVQPLAADEQMWGAAALSALGRMDDAVGQLSELLDSHPEHAGARLLRATINQQLGKHMEAIADIEEAIRLDPNFADAYWFLTQSKKFTPEDAPFIAQMKEAQSRASNPHDRGVLSFAIGSASNDLKQYGEAMAAFEEGNALFKQISNLSFHQSELKDFTDKLIATFDKDFFQKHSKAALDSQRPLFILGMARSGTTLTETIFSCHPEVAAGGELSFWGDNAGKVLRLDSRSIDDSEAHERGEAYLQVLEKIGPRCVRVTDKLPYNYFNVGLLHTIFPRARMLHCRRNPVDNCLSFFMTVFNSPPPYAHDKANIVFAYREYARLMAHWKRVIPPANLKDVVYEEIVSSPERIKELVLFAGLKWDDACLHPESSERQISTMSHWQARQPIYKSSTERWRSYEPWLGEFRDLLENPPTF